MASIKGTVFVVPRPKMDAYALVVDKGQLNKKLQDECRKVAMSWPKQDIPISKGAIDETKLEKLLLKLLAKYAKEHKIPGKLTLAPAAHTESSYYHSAVKFWCERTEDCDLTTATEQKPWQFDVAVDGQTVPVDVTLVVQHPFIPNEA